MIPAIVLAAGKSTRMGRPKATLPLPGGDTFLSRIVRTFHAAGVNDVVVVLGHEAESIADACAREPAQARFVLNPDYERGQFSSLIKGLNAVDRPGIAATLLTLVDVPLVTAETVRMVLERYANTHAPIVRPTRVRPSWTPDGSSDAETEHGHPVLIDRSLFDAIRRANPADGAKPVVRSHASAAGDLAIADEGAFFDIDTAEEYRRLMEGG
jgi:molybdenum cofactor cytidylyltransferase